MLTAICALTIRRQSHIEWTVPLKIEDGEPPARTLHISDYEHSVSYIRVNSKFPVMMAPNIISAVESLTVTAY